MNLLRRAVGEKTFRAFLDDPVAFVRAFDRDPWPFQADILREMLARGEDGKFSKRIAVVSMPRQNGKSTLSGWAALWRLFCDPDHQELVSVALDRESARIILNDARRIISRSEILSDLVDPNWGLTKGEIRLKDGRRWLIKSAEAIYSRGMRPSMVCYDEMGWSSDDGDLFQVLSAGQAAQPNPLMVITSTVGPIQAGPLWELFQSAEARDPDIYFNYSTENLSPLITNEFLETQRKQLPAFVYAREHQNQWGVGTDTFCTLEDWNRAVADGSPLRDRDPGPCYLFCDLGWAHDETAIAVSKREGEKVDIVHLSGFKPGKGRQVEFAEVERTIRELAMRLNIERVEIESPQGVGMAQSLTLEGLQAEILHPTSKSNMERWGALNVALKNGSVRLPKDPTLRRQLLTLTIKESVTGWRVVDVPSIHNDRAVAIAGALFMAKTPPIRLLMSDDPYA